MKKRDLLARIEALELRVTDLEWRNSKGPSPSWGRHVVRSIDPFTGTVEIGPPEPREPERLVPRLELVPPGTLRVHVGGIARLVPGAVLDVHVGASMPSVWEAAYLEQEARKDHYARNKPREVRTALTWLGIEDLSWLDSWAAQRGWEDDPRDLGID